MNIPPNFPPTWASGWGEDEFGCFATLELAPGEVVVTPQSRLWKRPVEMLLRWVSPGSFQMGDENNGPAHQVKLTQGFWLADTACTQAQWRAVMGEHESHFKGDDLPVEQVSWEDCQTFCQRLAERFGQRVFRLPTEAQWEYACRAGTTTLYSFGENITPNMVNHNGNCPDENPKSGLCREKTVPVRSLRVNPWGFYEIHGNVQEWCQDWQKKYSPEDQEDPTGPPNGKVRVVRGGSWGDLAWDCRSACRLWLNPVNRSKYLGFRLSANQG